jgi:hypothetical protein
MKMNTPLKSPCDNCGLTSTCAAYKWNQEHGTVTVGCITWKQQKVEPKWPRNVTISRKDLAFRGYCRNCGAKWIMKDEESHIFPDKHCECANPYYVEYYGTEEYVTGSPDVPSVYADLKVMGVRIVD